MRVRSIGSLFTVAVVSIGCGGEDPPVASIRWRYEAGATVAAPGLGPDARVLAATMGQTGRIATLEEANGLVIEGPYDLFPTAHAPVASGTDLFVVSSIGRLVRVNLAGESQSSTLMLGPTSGPAVAPDGTVRLASTSGRVVGFAKDLTVLFDTPIDGATDRTVAVDAAGTTFVATDTGRLVGVSATGQVILNETVNAPAAGPSTASGKVAVGEIDGVRLFAADGGQIWRHARGARVVGTRILDGGDVLAWGEDGALERLGGDGSVVWRVEMGPPIYTDVFAIGAGSVGVIDSLGTAARIGPDGTKLVTLALGGEVQRGVAVGSVGFAFVGLGQQILALDFGLSR